MNVYSKVITSGLLGLLVVYTNSTAIAAPKEQVFLLSNSKLCKSNDHPGAFGYELINNDLNKSYIVSVKVSWQGANGNGNNTQNYAVGPTQKVFVGCSVSGYPRSTSYSYIKLSETVM